MLMLLHHTRFTHVVLHILSKVSNSAAIGHADVSGVREATVDLLSETARVSAGDDAARDATFAQSLARAIRSAGYDAEPLPPARDADAESLAATFDETLRRQRQACLLAIGPALPILALELFGARLQAAHVAGALGWRILQAALTIMLLISPAAGPMLVGGLRGLLHRAANADALVAVGLLVGTVSSIAGTLTLRGEFIRFDAVAWIVTITAVGRLFEARARERLTRMAYATRKPRSWEMGRGLRLSDRAAELLVIVGVTLAIVLLVGGMLNVGVMNDADAIGAAVAVLVAGSPRALGLASTVATIGEPSERSRQILRQNLSVAYACNVAAMSAAVIGRLPPAWAAAVSTCATWIVLLNSLRVRKGSWVEDPGGGAGPQPL